MWFSKTAFQYYSCLMATPRSGCAQRIRQRSRRLIVQPQPPVVMMTDDKDKYWNRIKPGCLYLLASSGGTISPIKICGKSFINKLTLLDTLQQGVFEKLRSWCVGVCDEMSEFLLQRQPLQWQVNKARRLNLAKQCQSKNSLPDSHPTIEQTTGRSSFTVKCSTGLKIIVFYTSLTCALFYKSGI